MQKNHSPSICNVKSRRAEHNLVLKEEYEWEIRVPPWATEESLVLPKPTFENGLLSDPSWVENFAGSCKYIYKAKSDAILELQLPTLIPTHVDTMFSWKLRSHNPRVSIKRDENTKMDPGCERGMKMNYAGGDWDKGETLIYSLQIHELYTVRSLQFSIVLYGSYQQSVQSLFPKVQTCKSIATLFNQKDFSDVQIICEGEMFQCHKNILSVGSPVFQRMLLSDMKETKEGKVFIEHVAQDTLRLMLEWMYGMDIALKLTNIQQKMELYALIDRYLVDSLKDLLRKDMLNTATPDEAVDMSALGHTCGDLELVKGANEVLNRNSNPSSGLQFNQEKSPACVSCRAMMKPSCWVLDLN